MNKVVIVVPVYKIDLDVFENVSLMQLHRILGHYPIFYVMPNRLRNNFLESYLQIVFFPDSYFVSTEAYSKLCLSSGFYETFREYEYMLIYQTDAFVFSDRLMEFCDLGYDYIGAPLPRMNQYWHELKARVGNGGLSLRRISAVLRILEKKEDILYQVRFMKKAIMQYEDLFFGYCGTVPELEFHVPSVPLAVNFSIENDVSHCYRRLKNYLPFGCHAWCRVNYQIWRKKIEGYGYILPQENSSMDTNEIRRISLMRYLVKRILRRNTFQVQSFFLQTLFYENQYSIWGAGKDGRECIDILERLGKKICCVFDILRDEEMENELGISCFLPNRDCVIRSGVKLIVAAQAHECEIITYIHAWGLKKDEDYIVYSALRDRFIAHYCSRFLPE